MPRSNQTVRLMGTVIDVMIDHPESERLTERVIHQLKCYEQRFSANDADSELMAVNKQAGKQPVSVHPDLFHLIQIGKEHSCDPESHLNIAIGPLVQSWRIGFQDARVPTQEQIDQVLPLTDANAIELDDNNQTVFLKHTGMKIDLGCLAKGYIADLIVADLKQQGVSSALLNLGGNIVGIGPEKDVWRIGIQDPTQPRNEYVTVVPIQNQSVVTSGIYERSLEKDGQTYHHILDPKTGYPMETNVVSFTIISMNSVDGEIWTTRLYGKPANEIINGVNQVDGIEGIVMTEDGTILYSNGLNL